MIRRDVPTHIVLAFLALGLGLIGLAALFYILEYSGEPSTQKIAAGVRSAGRPYCAVITDWRDRISENMQRNKCEAPR
jgi:hypothetical protein